MGTLATVRNHARLICSHPALVRWYFRNRARQLTLGGELKRPDGVSRPPRGVAIKPTLSCNLRCKMCSFAIGGDVLSDPKDHLPLEAWMPVIDDLARHHSYITLTGGEPMLYPYISELILHIKKRGLICTVTSNGTMVGKHAPTFMKDPPDAMITSIDGPTEVHDEIRGRAGTFERASEGVRIVRELRKKAGHRRPFLIINCAITSLNYRHVEEIVDIAHDLGMDALNYQHQWSLTRRMIEAHNRKHGECHYVGGIGEIDLPPPDVDEIVGIVRRIRRRAQTNNGRMYIRFHPELDDEDVRRWYENPHTWVQRTTPACAWITSNILPNGDVEPCLGLTCGNITTESFADIWNNEAYREHRKRLSTCGDLPICPRCCAYFRRD